MIISAKLLPPTFIRANIASNTPTKPSPAIKPEVYKIPLSTWAFFSASLDFFLFSVNNLTKPPTIIPALKCIGRYKPTANGSIGIPRTSTANPILAPANINGQGRFPSITPSTTSFIRVACGAGISFEPNPHAVSNK